MTTVNQAIVWAADTARGWHMARSIKADAAANLALWHLGHSMHAAIARKPGERWQVYVRRTAAKSGV